MAKDISMRHTKLKPEEVALIAGEISKPSWESRNEGIHERVSFEDTIWGFDLAGGAYYNTPLRVTFVKPDSRAEKANVRPGDLLLRINNIDTTTMTIKEAHDIIVESGINLKLNVTAPEDVTDSFYYYEDPLVEEAALAEKRLADEKARRAKWFKPRDGAFMKLQWPWVSKRCLVYRESNCFLVPSKYEELHKDKFPVPLTSIRYLDNVILDNMDKQRYKLLEEESLAKEQQKGSTEKSGEDNAEKSTEDIKDLDQNNIDSKLTVDNNHNENQEISHDDDDDDGIDENNVTESITSNEEEGEENNNELANPIEDSDEGLDEHVNLKDDTDEEALQHVSSADDVTATNHEENNDQIQTVVNNNAEEVIDVKDVIDIADVTADTQQVGSSHDNELLDIDNVEYSEVVQNGQHGDDTSVVEDKDIDLNNNPMTDLVNDSDISEGSSGGNRNI